MNVMYLNLKTNPMRQVLSLTDKEAKTGIKHELRAIHWLHPGFQIPVASAINDSNQVSW